MHIRSIVRRPGCVEGTVLGLRPLAVAPVGRDEWGDPVVPQSGNERADVERPVADQVLGCIVEEALGEGGRRERDFMRRSTCKPGGGDRKTRAV